MLHDLNIQIEIEMSKGDVLFFHNLLFHSSKINNTSKIRWTLDLRYSRIPGLTDDKTIQQAEDWFLKKLNSGWGPMNICGSQKNTSYEDWVLKRNNNNLPGKAGSVG